MNEPGQVRVTICAAVGDAEEVAAVRRWLDKWRPSLGHFSDYGCGCCVELYDVLAPAGSLAELPEGVRAESDWTRG